MIILDVYLDKNLTTTEVKVYENVQEFKDSGLKLYSMKDVTRLNYVKTQDGFYVPCLKKNIMTTSHKNKLFYSWHFPFGVTFNNTYYIEEDRFAKKIFRWSDNFQPPKYRSPKNRINERERLAASLIAEGVDIYKAFQFAFPKQAYINMQVKRTISKSKFIELIIEMSDMNELKKALQDNEAHKKVAQSLIELIEAKKSNNEIDLAARKFGFEIYANIERITSSSDDKMLEDYEDFKLIEDKIIKKIETT